MNAITTANITWQTDHLGNTVPVSTAFDDVYFSHAGGLAESHYVFVEGNDLPNRLTQLQAGETFVVAETGFGTGLNFLALCKLWQHLTAQGDICPTARLHFISTEKFPLTQDNLAQALSAWQDDSMADFIDELVANYPSPMMGCHRLHFADNIMLDLWFGDALASFQTIHQAYLQGQHTARVNAWFLDGFAPAKNAELWSDELFALMAPLSADGASVATFTAAGFVRRGLQAVGFAISKQRGFGRKREMLVGQFCRHAHTNNTPNTDNTQPKHIAIIGTGICGLCTAYALAMRGKQVTLLDKDAPLAGASGNLRAMFAPKLSLIEQANHHLSTVSFLYAERFYQAMNAHADVFNQTGVVDFLLPTQKSYDKLHALITPYPDELIHEIAPLYPKQTIHTLVPKAGLINPKHLAQAILSHPLITWRRLNVQRIESHDDGVTLHGDDELLMADTVVISAGFASHLLDDKLFNPRKIRGQVSWLSVNDDTFAHLPTRPIKYDGYCAKFDDGGDKRFLMGASFVRNCTDTAINADEHEFNIDKLNQSLPDVARLLGVRCADLQGRASIRAQTPDYHPIVGQIDKRIFAIYGMGSKGFTFAPLCGEMVAGMIQGEILPISDVLYNKIKPNRPRLATPLADNTP